MKNKVLYYVVRVPGKTSWSSHLSKEDALRERHKADQVRPGHKVFAVHEDGFHSMIPEDGGGDDE